MSKTDIPPPHPTEKQAFKGDTSVSRTKGVIGSISVLLYDSCLVLPTMLGEQPEIPALAVKKTPLKYHVYIYLIGFFKKRNGLQFLCGKSRTEW